MNKNFQKNLKPIKNYKPSRQKKLLIMIRQMVTGLRLRTADMFLLEVRNLADFLLMTQS